MNRDARGRFVTSEEAAATLVLEAAVREAVAVLRSPRDLSPNPKASMFLSADHSRFVGGQEKAAELVLHHAIHAADLLLRKEAS